MQNSFRMRLIVIFAALSAATLRTAQAVHIQNEVELEAELDEEEK